MAKYCRYCSWAFKMDTNKVRCKMKDRVFTSKYVKHTNTCESFDLNSVDVLRENDKGYKPTGVKIVQFGGLGEQLEMDVVRKKKSRGGKSK